MACHDFVMSKWHTVAKDLSPRADVRGCVRAQFRARRLAALLPPQRSPTRKRRPLVLGHRFRAGNRRRQRDKTSSGTSTGCEAGVDELRLAANVVF
jgi:hypothetical protein